MIFNGLCMFLLLTFSTLSCIRDQMYLNKQSRNESKETSDDKDHVRSIDEIMSFKANKHDQRHSTKYEFQNMNEWIDGQKEMLNNEEPLESTEKSLKDPNEDIDLEPTEPLL